MNQVAMQDFSAFVVTGKRQKSKEEPERFYHGFVLGWWLTLQINTELPLTGKAVWTVRYYDGALEKNKRAYVIEFKVHKAKREKDLEETAQNALQQIAEELWCGAYGTGNSKRKYQTFGICIWGKKVLIEQE